MLANRCWTISPWRSGRSMKIENVSCFSLAATTPFHRWISAAPGEEWGWEGRWSSCSCWQGWAISFACQIRLKIRLQTKFLSDLQNGSREWMHVSAFHHIHRNPVHSVHIWYSYTHTYIYIYIHKTNIQLYIYIPLHIFSYCVTFLVEWNAVKTNVDYFIKGGSSCGETVHQSM